jgi:hypothetical protein
MSWSELIIGIKNVISVNVSRHSRIADVLILNVLFYLDLLSSIAFSVYIIHTKAISCDINPTTLVNIKFFSIGLEIILTFLKFANK